MLLLPCSFVAFAQSSAFKITGNISGWKGTMPVRLSYTDNGQNVADTVQAVNGKFMFSGTVTTAVPAQIHLLTELGNGSTLRDSRSFFIDRGTISLKGTDSLKTVAITGPKVTQENEILYAQLTPLTDRILALRIKALKMPKEQKQGQEYAEMEKEFAALTDRVKETKVAFIKKYPSSYISLHTVAATVQGNIKYNDVAPFYDLLSPEAKSLPLGVKLGKALAIAKKTNIGEVMPDFTSLDTLRKPLSLHEVVKKGKVTLVDLWASWCAPCRAENPNVVKAFNAFHDKGFNIISVSLDQSEANWKKAIVTDGMPWYHVSSLKYWNEPVAVEFGVAGIPDNFLLDADGRVIARGLRGDALYEKIKEALQ